MKPLDYYPVTLSWAMGDTDCEGNGVQLAEYADNLGTIVYYSFDGSSWLELIRTAPLVTTQVVDLNDIGAIPGQEVFFCLKHYWVTTGVESCSYSNVFSTTRGDIPPDEVAPPPPKGGGCGR